ncbi:MAG: apolipoprotein N-acyltransferase [Defluviimonas sp.]|uniref:apolipoprotein N-acyltransferase n=1 Tax=Albidovulum sp. TaxID=1872424 RepID=UPI001D4D0057|nr:apolipoprotein N-acyltransferase [Paracoccaceae bacterium]MCC0065086.1 apolipoprotein N-acyltransferase [Defluviimonas sp.]
MPAGADGTSARPRHAVRQVSLAAAFGALVALGQAPFALWWLAVAALAGFFLLVARTPGRARLLWLSAAAGTGYGAAGLFWIVEPFLVDAPRYGWMAPFALVLMALGMGAFWTLGGALALVAGSGRAARVAGLAFGLAAADLVRSYVFTGFPWNLTGHIWIGTPVMEAAAYVGPAGLCALTTLSAALPACATRTGPRLLLAALGAALLAAVWTGGTLRMAAPAAPRDPAIHVRLVQPNAAQDQKWQGDMRQVFLGRLFDLTARPAAKPLDLVVWPETAIPYLLEDTGPLFEDIARASGGVPLVAGIQRRDGNRYFNSLVATDGTGRILRIYDKYHLAPFGEYMPLGDLLARFGIGAFAAQAGFGYTPGPGARLLDLGRAGQVLPLICYEAIFPQDLNAAPARADWLLQVTNDAWFGKLSGPYQHLAQTRLRAVEQGLPLLRVANTGVSAVIDAHGRVLQSLPLDTEGIIDAEVPPALPATLYSRTGDVPTTIFLVAGLLTLALGRRRLSH